MESENRASSKSQLMLPSPFGLSTKEQYLSNFHHRWARSTYCSIITRLSCTCLRLCSTSFSASPAAEYTYKKGLNCFTYIYKISQYYLAFCKKTFTPSSKISWRRQFQSRFLSPTPVQHPVPAPLITRYPTFYLRACNFKSSFISKLCYVLGRLLSLLPTG